MKLRFIPLLVIALLPHMMQAQSIGTVTPNSAGKGDFLDVSITGINTHYSENADIIFNYQGSPSDDIFAMASSTSTPTMMKAWVAISPFAQTGTYDLEISTFTDGTMSKSNAFTVGAATRSIVAVGQNFAAPGSTVHVSVTGAGTHFTQGSPSF